MVLRFSGSHVWVRKEDGEAVLGLSDYLQDQMGEITSLDLPDVGDVIRVTRRMGNVESEGASSPIEAPISGEVLEVNPEALENPDVVNSDPYGGGWLLRVRMDDPRELEDLISEEEYADLTTEVKEQADEEIDGSASLISAESTHLPERHWRHSRHCRHLRGMRCLTDSEIGLPGPRPSGRPSSGRPSPSPAS